METNTDMAVSGTVFPLGISDFENLISNGHGLHRQDILS